MTVTLLSSPKPPKRAREFKEECSAPTRIKTDAAISSYVIEHLRSGLAAPDYTLLSPESQRVALGRINEITALRKSAASPGAPIAFPQKIRSYKQDTSASLFIERSLIPFSPEILSEVRSAIAFLNCITHFCSVKTFSHDSFELFCALLDEGNENYIIPLLLVLSEKSNEFFNYFLLSEKFSRILLKKIQKEDPSILFTLYVNLKPCHCILLTKQLISIFHVIETSSDSEAVFSEKIEPLTEKLNAFFRKKLDESCEWSDPLYSLNSFEYSSPLHCLKKNLLSNFSLYTIDFQLENLTSLRRVVETYRTCAKDLGDLEEIESALMEAVYPEKKHETIDDEATSCMEINRLFRERISATPPLKCTGI